MNDLSPEIALTDTSFDTELKSNTRMPNIRPNFQINIIDPDDEIFVDDDPLIKRSDQEVRILFE